MESNYTCIIVDDERLARQLLTNYIEKTSELKLAGTFKSAQEVLDFLQSNSVDLLFSDIQMPHLSGISLVENNAKLPAVIFTTAYEEYAVKAFELEVIDYLVKPFSNERFQQAVQKFLSYRMLRDDIRNSTYLMVKSSNEYIRIAHDNLLYIEANGEYMKLVVADGLPELIYMRMKELEVRLGPGFIRVHKSFLVNREKITKMSGSSIWIGDKKLTVSRRC